MASRGRVLLVVTIVTCMALGFSGGRGDERKSDPHVAQFETLLRDRAASVVTIRYVLKTTVEGEEDEEDAESTGVLVDPAGWVVCSSSGLGDVAGDGFRISASDFKVLIGDDHEGEEASLVARDKELDLAWVRLRKAPTGKLPAVDLSSPPPVRAGERLMTLRRLGRFFDRAPEVLEGRVSAVLSKPRDLYAPGSGMGGAVGEPVFNTQGQFVGIYVLQAPEADDEDSESAEDLSEVMILPGATVAKATERAKKSPPAANEAKPDAGKIKRA